MQSKIDNYIPTISAKDIKGIRSSTEYKMVMENAHRLFSPRSSLNYKMNSYGLKHLLEEYLKTIPEFTGPSTYSHNDTFVIAMNDLGYRLKQGERNSLNYWMNVEVAKTDTMGPNHINKIPTITPKEAATLRASREYALVIDYAHCIFSKRKTINSAGHSYGFKHQLSAYLDDRNDFDGITYTSNSAFIIAMNDLGYRLKQYERNSPNYRMNLSVNYKAIDLARQNRTARV